MFSCFKHNNRCKVDWYYSVEVVFVPQISLGWFFEVAFLVAGAKIVESYLTVLSYCLILKNKKEKFRNVKEERLPVK